MWCVSASPICCQVTPASRERYTPLPHDELWRLLASPVPAHTTEGSDSATATAPMEDTPSLSKMGCHVVKALVVFHRPPPARPTYTILGSRSTTATSSARPPIIAGPISRNFRFLIMASSDGCARRTPAEAIIRIRSGACVPRLDDGSESWRNRSLDLSLWKWLIGDSPARNSFIVRRLARYHDQRGTRRNYSRKG